MTTPTGSILLRRGPTTDRVAFVPLDGEIIYDENLKSIFIGDGATYGGNAVGTVPGSMSNSFANILVAGQSNVTADSYSDNLTLIAGTGITLTTDAINDSITIASSAAGATYGISAETATGGTSLRLTGSNVTTDNVKFAEGTGITVTRTDADTITIATTVTDTNTTYGISAETVVGGAHLRLTGSNASTDNIKFASAGNVTVSRTDANTITISGSSLGGAVLDDLADVSLSVPTNGQFLRYNGTNWYNATATLGGGALSSSFETIRVAGQPDVVADSSTDILTLVAGPGITLTSNAVTDTITINNSGSLVSVSPAIIAAGTAQSTATVLTSIINNITTADIENIIGSSVLTITNDEISSYVIDTVNNPTLNFIRGWTYTFNINAPGHPFWIKTAQVTGTGSTYDTGVTNNGAASGTITFTVPFDAPSILYYNCQYHTLMAGTINITDPNLGYTGVRLPTAVAGTRLLVFNNGSNIAYVYPAAGADINGLGNNLAFSLDAGAKLEFVAITTTQWYTMNATYA